MVPNAVLDTWIFRGTKAGSFDRGFGLVSQEDLLSARMRKGANVSIANRVSGARSDQLSSSVLCILSVFSLDVRGKALYWFGCSICLIKTVVL